MSFITYARYEVGILLKNCLHLIVLTSLAVRNSRAEIVAQRPTCRNGNAVLNAKYALPNDIHRNQAVPTRKTILRWVNALCTEGTLLNKKR